jgi:amidase
MDNLVFLPAYELANLIRGGEISSREVIAAYLHHISLYNPSLNAIVTLDTKLVLQQAQKADQALAKGEFLGPLHGVPITIKDSLETQGIRTTCSYEPLHNYIPQKDATVVARLRQAGAIILGKTNTPKLTGDFQTNSPIFGRTNNPWNLDYTPGGSTGGGAAAIAAGLSPLDIGSDLGGSIRVPAHFCGICGLKPTENRVSTFGHIPELPGHPKTIKHLQTVGPLARSIEDLSLCLSIIEGVDIQQEWVTKFSETFDQIKSLKSYRFAWTKYFGEIPSCSDTQSALENLALTLTKLECSVKNNQPSGINFSKIWEIYQNILGYEFRVNPQINEVKKYQYSLDKRQIIIQQIESFFEHWDVWLTPVVPIPAFPHCPFGSEIEIEGKKYPYFEAIGAYTTLFNLTGHPVVVLPLSLSAKGLPIGVQLVGKRGEDMKLLTIACKLSKIIDIVPCPLNY